MDSTNAMKKLRPLTSSMNTLSALSGRPASSGFCTVVIRSCEDTERYGTTRPDDCGVVVQAGGAESGGCDAAVRTGGVDVGVRVIRFRTGALGGGGTWGVEGPRPEVDDARIGGDRAAVGDFPRGAGSETNSA